MSPPGAAPNASHRSKRNRQTYLESLAPHDAETMANIAAKRRRTKEKQTQCSCGCMAMVSIKTHKRHLEKKGRTWRLARSSSMSTSEDLKIFRLSSDNTGPRFDAEVVDDAELDDEGVAEGCIDQIDEDNAKSAEEDNVTAVETFEDPLIDDFLELEGELANRIKSMDVPEDLAIIYEPFDFARLLDELVTNTASNRLEDDQSFDGTNLQLDYDGVVLDDMSDGLVDHRNDFQHIWTMDLDRLRQRMTHEHEDEMNNGDQDVDRLGGDADMEQLEDNACAMVDFEGIDPMEDNEPDMAIVDDEDDELEDGMYDLPDPWNPNLYKETGTLTVRDTLNIDFERQRILNGKYILSKLL